MLSRRETLRRCANGFGGMALSALLAEWGSGEARADTAAGRTLDPMRVRPPHFKAKANSVIFLFMDGGVSHVDSFDPKERLQKESGKELPLKRPQHVRAVSPIAVRLAVRVSPLWPVRSRGEQPVSAHRDLRRRPGDRPLDGGRTFRAHRRQLFHAQRIRTARAAEHGRVGHLSAWAATCRNLPGFVVMDTGMIPPGRHRYFRQRLSPGQLSGFAVPPQADSRWPTSRRARPIPRSRKASSICCATSRPPRRSRYGPVDEMEAAIANYELAFRMQTAVPELMDLSGETEATTKALRAGRDRHRQISAAQCLLARRLVERGVRFIELLPPKRDGADRWDQHARAEGRTRGERQGDRPADRRRCSRT